jgi:ribonuclease H2 subunit A
MPFIAPPDYLPNFDGRPVQLGIDEAGRGPVVGPMVYGCCYSPIDAVDEVARSGFMDSKQLSEEKRERLWAATISTKSLPMGYIANILSAESISGQMLGRSPHNLNAISYDAAITMIRKVQIAGAKIEEVYVDTVGDPLKYQNHLKMLFPTIKTVVVCPKADSIYPIVSAASIVAKVNRDFTLQDIGSIMREGAAVRALVEGTTLGSGYPSDERTKDWLRACLERVFLFPAIVRFSWDTVNQLADGKSVGFDFHDEVEDPNQPSLMKMMKSKDSKLFENRNLSLPTMAQLVGA